ncbi:hypothetical protein ASPTUDRAFT_42335, partial [Aspergillus tubingensis CBS 134.48]
WTRNFIRILKPRPPVPKDSTSNLQLIRSIIMAKSSNHNSSTRNQLQCTLDKHPQASVLASCYSVKSSTSVVDSFHYCTTAGAGTQWYP